MMARDKDQRKEKRVKTMDDNPKILKLPIKFENGDGTITIKLMRATKQAKTFKLRCLFLNFNLKLKINKIIGRIPLQMVELSYNGKSFQVFLVDGFPKKSGVKMVKSFIGFKYLIFADSATLSFCLMEFLEEIKPGKS